MENNLDLGRLEQVPLREVWRHEALDFTQWLAKQDNLTLLSDSIGIDLIDAQTEVGVGQFNVDILAEDGEGRSIVIENQLEPTNHDHLGKIITYAAGLQAEVIIWVVEYARPEHEQAINWLNENTTEDANFFLLQIEAWRIGDSAPAPRFNIIARPNDWAKKAKQSASGTTSELKIKQRDFFEKIKEYGTNNASNIRSWRNARPQHWYNIALGSSQAHIALSLNSNEQRVSVEIYIRDNKELFYQLRDNKYSIETDLGYELDWRELPERVASRILIQRDGDFMDESQAEELIRWLVDTADNFARVFPKFL